MPYRLLRSASGAVHPDRVVRHERRHPAWIVGLAVLSAATVFVSHEFTREAGRVASIWPLNALLLAIILRWPGVSAATVLAVGGAANVVVDLAMGDTLLNAVALASANLVEVSICVVLLRRRGSWFDISRPSALLHFVAVAGCLAPAASSIIAAIALSGSAPFADTLGTWFAADALGMLIFAPALLSIRGPKEFGSSMRRSRIEWAIDSAILLATLLLVFGQNSFPLPFLVLPVVLFVTFRGGVTATALSLLLTAIVAIACAVAGYGPTQLITGGETEKVLVLQAFLAVTTLTSLIVAAALAEGARAHEALRLAREEAEFARAAALTSESHYRTLADNSTDIVVRFGKGGIISYASPACRILGISPSKPSGEQQSISQYQMIANSLQRRWRICSAAANRTVRFDASFACG